MNKEAIFLLRHYLITVSICLIASSNVHAQDPASYNKDRSTFLNNLGLNDAQAMRNSNVNDLVNIENKYKQFNLASYALNAQNPDLDSTTCSKYKTLELQATNIMSDLEASKSNETSSHKEVLMNSYNHQIIKLGSIVTTVNKFTNQCELIQANISSSDQREDFTVEPNANQSSNLASAESTPRNEIEQQSIVSSENINRERSSLDSSEQQKSNKDLISETPEDDTNEKKGLNWKTIGIGAVLAAGAGLLIANRNSSDDSNRNNQTENSTATAAAAPPPPTKIPPPPFTCSNPNPRFMWQPVDDDTKKLIILFSGKYKQTVTDAFVKYEGGIEFGKRLGPEEKNHGCRSVYNFSKKGSTYKKAYIYALHGGRACKYKVPNPGKRVESLTPNCNPSILAEMNRYKDSAPPAPTTDTSSFVATPITPPSQNLVSNQNFSFEDLLD